MGEARTGAASTVDVPSDERAARLTRAVSRGDRGACEELCRGWFDRVFRMARAATKRDESFCLDVVQDVMMRVVKSMRPLEGERELKAWMGKATISCAIDRLRNEQRRARRERTVAGAAHSPAADHASDGTLAERIEWLRGQMERMGPEDRALVELRFGHGRTLDAAGEAAGVSGDAAHGRLRRALRMLVKSATEMLP